MARDLLSVPWEPIGAILAPYRGHVGVHFGLPVANLTFLKAFGAPLGLSFGLRAQFWIDFRSNLAPPSLQTSSMGTAECAERSAAPPQVAPRAGFQIQVLGKYLQAQNAQLQKPRPRSPDYPLSISPPGSAHSAGPGQNSVSASFVGLFFEFLAFQNAVRKMLRKNIEKNAKIEDFGLPKPSQNLTKYRRNRCSKKHWIFQGFLLEK